MRTEHEPGSPVNVAIFAKAPVAGLAKTRLIPWIGAEEAASLQQHLIGRAVAIAVAAEIGSVSLWCAPDCNHSAFPALARTFPIVLFGQAGGDLGKRMHVAFEALTPSAPLVLIGVDCPPLTPDHLRLCADRLRLGDDAVFLPTEDGGYALIGLHRPERHLFEGIAWGGATVMEVTRQRLTECSMVWSEPDMLWDLDRPEDLQRWKALSNDDL